uniref:Uncharacterized protein n=1 Tax=Candidozyma auris TaxID=498019 RepID=A0A0L0NSI4_CANAR
MMLPSSPVFQIKRDFCQILQFGVFHWLRVHSTIGIEYGKNEGTEMNESRLNTSFNKYRQCWTFASFEVMILVCTQCNSIGIDVSITTSADLINSYGYSQSGQIHPIYGSDESFTLTPKDGEITVPSTLLGDEIAMLNPLSCNDYLYRRYAIESIVTITNTFEREPVLRSVEMIVAKDCGSSCYGRSPKVGHFFITGKLSGYTFDPMISGKSFDSNEINELT